MESSSPLRLFPQRVPSKWTSKVEFSSGFHPITNLMLWNEFLMVYLGYNEYINMYFNLTMINCDSLVQFEDYDP